MFGLALGLEPVQTALEPHDRGGAHEGERWPKDVWVQFVTNWHVAAAWYGSERPYTGVKGPHRSEKVPRMSGAHEGEEAHRDKVAHRDEL